MSFPTRRTFLQTAVAAVASFFLPRGLRAGEHSRSFWFLHTPTREAWAVDDPVTWALANAQQPILERASAGLRKLTPADDQRIIRLVTRRCRLNLIEIHPGRVVVHFWGQQGQGDLRPFFKQHGLARNAVRVILIDRKREASTAQTGDDFLYGERLARDFAAGRCTWRKWQRRAIEEPDDWTPAPCSGSGFAWKGIEPNRIPWAALKSAWRHENAPALPELRPAHPPDRLRLSLERDVQPQAVFHPRLREMPEAVRGSVGHGRVEMDGGEPGCRGLARLRHGLGQDE